MSMIRDANISRREGDEAIQLQVDELKKAVAKLERACAALEKKVYPLVEFSLLIREDDYGWIQYGVYGTFEEAAKNGYYGSKVCKSDISNFAIVGTDAYLDWISSAGLSGTNVFERQRLDDLTLLDGYWKILGEDDD